MSRRRTEVLLWLIAAALLLWGRARWLVAVPAVPGASTPAIAPVAEPDSGTLAQRLKVAEAAAAGNPFRLDRSPAQTLDAGMSDPAEPPPPPPFRPPLAVSGLVGPPWTAVLEGVPGREVGVLVRGGERLGELRVRSVSPAGVVVSAPDTTWRLTVRRTWQ